MPPGKLRRERPLMPVQTTRGNDGGGRTTAPNAPHAGSRNTPPAGQGPLVMLALAIGILLMTVQLWLLTLALNLYLSGGSEGTVIAAVISGLIFVGGLLMLRLLWKRPQHRA